MGAIFVGVLALTEAISPKLPSGRLSGLSFWALAGVGVIVDFALTFVTPELAFSTRSVRTALKAGLAMIGREWPRSAPYVLVPPLAIWIVFRAVPRSQFHGPVAVTASVASGLVGFAFKGAIARYYLRQHPTGEDGAAFIPKQDVAQPPRPDANLRTIPRPSHLMRIRLLESTISQEDECTPR